MIIEKYIGIDTNYCNVSFDDGRKIIQASNICEALGISNITLAMKKLEKYDKCKQYIDYQIQHGIHKNEFKKAWFISEWGAVRLAIFYKNKSTKYVLARLEQSDDQMAKKILEEYKNRKKRQK